MANRVDAQCGTQFLVGSVDTPMYYIPVSKVSCHLANKMSANVWHTSYVDQYDTTCCGHDYNQVEPSGTESGTKPLCLDF